MVIFPVYWKCMNATAGYREIEHTADWELHIWAPDLISLLESAARGMYALSHTVLADRPRLSRAFEIPFLDREALLVDFLSELLFFVEDEHIAFDEYHLVLERGSLTAQLGGAPLATQAKEIKAVTYHRLQIHPTERGLEVNIVFDV